VRRDLRASAVTCKSPLNENIQDIEDALILESPHSPTANCVEVAVPTPLPQTFTYRSPAPIAAGSRVLVPFGRRKVVGVALGPGAPIEQELKDISSLIDESPVYSATVLELARWISTYYMHPIGEVLRTMLPASATKTTKETLLLTSKGQELLAGAKQIDPARETLKKLFGKKTSLTATVAKAKFKRIEATGLTLTAIKQLTKRGLITLDKGQTVGARRDDTSTAKNRDALRCDVAAPLQNPILLPTVSPPLTELQTGVFNTIVAEGLKADKRPPAFLIHGVTGSGKTEVYLNLIQSLLTDANDAQTLVLVPEISLTPQMTRVFESRFPSLVAVVHSAMTDTDRWKELTRIRRGEAKILIGPRSAVFGPFAKLKLLIVDEEHDSSYKQSTGLTYHGRDIAVLRGKLEDATVVLGSATPSMESYNNALTGKYRLLEMAERVTGRALPDVELLQASFKANRKGVQLPNAAHAPASVRASDLVDESQSEIPIDPRIVSELAANVASGNQAIVLVNRRGYAYYLLSLEERKAVQCPQCSISLTLHTRSTVLRCHYCDYRTTVAQLTKKRSQETFIAIGYGSEKAEDCLKAKLPQARIVRLDSDSVAKRDMLPETLGKFRAGEIDILVGTQILAKGHDFPKVTLIAILEVDQLLGLPDFRAGERTFQLIVQAAGRAGRAEQAGRVLIQTLRPQHPVVTTAMAQDFKLFAQTELKFRRTHAYPPFARLIAVEFNSPDLKKLSQLTRHMEGWFDQMATIKPALLSKVRVLGPSIPPIETIRGRHRRTVLFSATQQEPLRQLTQQFLSIFQKLPTDVRMKIDVDPQSLI
jgi:primosomal protein N' (replication factor Y)